jgi:hypothetical protein
MKRTRNKLLAALAVTAVVLLPIGANIMAANATAAPHKAFVCKYVGTPGVNETLQTGQNPIDVDFNAIGEDPVVVGLYFNDAQGRSFVLALDVGQESPSASDCPSGDTPTDVCPNIEGDQATVPEGDVIDDNGDCVPLTTTPPPVDVCPNIEGDQATVPEGYELNNDGQCVPIGTQTPPPPPATPEAFIFSSCTDTFIRFEGTGNAYYSVDGVFTDVTISVNPTDVDLGQLANGTVVTAAFNGGDVRTLTVDNAGCQTPSPTPPPKACPADQFPCWQSTWTPAPPIPTFAGGPPSGGDLAMTGSNVTRPAIGMGLLTLLGLGALALTRKRSIASVTRGGR